ncbi:hypothetical protein AMK16_24900 [Streptomyces sp. CB00455]|uniref:hypothetical protein n=1 Tax=Streptomyces sp. CB00455 TaxID=1703927 RepID=UPI00093D711B|nr:hypothetical protein [Streptomyces sp. CB00455]OKK15988.1 hypothetical protein AMK16_24900 [Streptomyces sp. CB00455]
MKSNPLLSLAPWIVFTLAAGNGIAAQWSAALAALVALAAAVPSIAARRPKLLDAMGIVTFAALSALAFAGGHGAQDFVTDYGRTVATGALAVLILLTLPVMPFTEQYAREEVPRAAWGSPVFKRTNRLFSAAWGGVFALMTLAHLVASAAPHSTGLDVVCNWIVPIVAVQQMFAFMKRYRARHTPSAA